ncbi:MAG: hypothetical protein R2759_10450 [Bacteroidales bacterium]
MISGYRFSAFQFSYFAFPQYIATSYEKELYKQHSGFCFFHALLYSQINGIGTPLIENYSRSDFKAGQQNWMIDQAPDGRLYFANNDGLLEFDGINWHLHRLPNGTFVRSIYAAADGKIYVGGYNEFVAILNHSYGAFTYRPLYSSLKPKSKFC